MALVLNGSNDTITGLQINSANIVDGSVTIADLAATGTASSSTFLRGDGTFAAAGGGGASNVSFNSGNGIDFSSTSDASGMSSELLDDYEEGTWTPVLARSSGTTQSTYIYQYGSYTKVGRVVHAVVSLYTTSGLGGSGTYHLNGLPFTPDTSNTGSIGSACSFRFSRLYLNNSDFAGGDNENTYELVSGQSYARLRNIDNNAQPTSLSGNTFILQGQITYFAAT